MTYRFWFHQDPYDVPLPIMLYIDKEFEDLIESKIEFYQAAFEGALREVLSEIL